MTLPYLQVPLKGWIPVSKARPPASNNLEEFHEKSSTSHKSFIPLTETTNTISNYTMPLNSKQPGREASIPSGSKPNENSNPLEGRLSRKSGFEANSSKNSVRYIQNKENHEARHRARSILANAIPSSPISSGPTTPAGSSTKSIAEFSTTAYSENKYSGNNSIKDFQCMSGNRKEAASNVDTGLDFKKDENFVPNNRESSESTINPEPEYTGKSRSTSIESSYCYQFKENTQSPMQISSSTSNETSRSSSPGMCLTTFALNSDGKGVPGAIYFSLHPDVEPTLNGEALPTAECLTSKNEITISHMQIEPKNSPKPSKSPIEISTKEHWLPVAHNADNTKSSQNKLSTARIPDSEKVAEQGCSKSEIYNHQISNPNRISSQSNRTYAFSRTQSNTDHKLRETPKSIASKNIASAIRSYEIATQGDKITLPHKVDCSSIKNSKSSTTAARLNSSDAIVTQTAKDIICPSCQLRFEKQNHLQFLDHFEKCKGPKFIDM